MNGLEYIKEDDNRLKMLLWFCSKCIVKVRPIDLPELQEYNFRDLQFAFNYMLDNVESTYENGLFDKLVLKYKQEVDEEFKEDLQNATEEVSELVNNMKKDYNLTDDDVRKILNLEVKE